MFKATRIENEIHPHVICTRKVIHMAQDSKCGTLMGILLIAFPIIALIFGNDEPAMQSDQAAFVMTAMIFIGVIMLANSNKKQNASTPAKTPVVYAKQVVPNTRYCPYCGAPLSTTDARYCSRCGTELTEL